MLQVVDCSDDGFITLLTDGGDLKSDLKLPLNSEGAPDEVAVQLQGLIKEGKSVLVTVLTVGTRCTIFRVRLGFTVVAFGSQGTRRNGACTGRISLVLVFPHVLCVD
eukprot:Polyplicarium_translucidae@DN2279_c0_g1_i4.p1